MKELNKKNITLLTKITEPFLMIDRITNILDMKSATGKKKYIKIRGFLSVTLLINL